MQKYAEYYSIYDILLQTVRLSLFVQGTKISNTNMNIHDKSTLNKLPDQISLWS